MFWLAPRVRGTLVNIEGARCGSLLPKNPLPKQRLSDHRYRVPERLRPRSQRAWLRQGWIRLYRHGSSPGEIWRYCCPPLTTIFSRRASPMRTWLLSVTIHGILLSIMRLVGSIRRDRCSRSFPPAVPFRRGSLPNRRGSSAGGPCCSPTSSSRTTRARPSLFTVGPDMVTAASTS